MRYVVVGAGAIGGGVAALLHESGHDVTVVARGETLRALDRAGLGLSVGHDRRTVRLRTAPSLADVSWTGDTVVLLTVKSHQTEPLLPDLVAIPPDVAVVCCQNGVSNERLLQQHREHVHGLVVMMPASSLAPGEVVIHSTNRPGLLDLGLADGGTDEVDHAVSRDLRSAGFDSVPRPDVMAWKRRKLLMNLGNAVDAAYADDTSAHTLLDLVRAEGAAALAAAGLPVVSREQDLARRGDLLRPLVRRDEAGSSTWQSIARGVGDTEATHLNGEVIDLGRVHGVATPANEAVLRDVTALARRGGGPRSLDAGAVLARLSVG